MGKTARGLYKFINVMYAVLMVMVLGVCLFAYQTEYSYRKLFQLPNWLYAVLGVIGIILVCAIIRLLGKVLNKCRYTRIIMMIMSILFGGMLIFSSYHYYFKTGWDAQMVELAAKAVADNDWVNVQNKYFSYYPNNAFLVFVFCIPIRLGALVGIDNYYFCIIMFQCVLFAWTGYLLYRCAEMLTDASCGLAVWVIYVLLVGISPWVVVPYSDATGLIFPTAQIYFFLRICKRERVNLHLFLLAFLCNTGYRIKPQAAIAGIAILLVGIIHLMQSGKPVLKEILTRAGMVFAGLVLAFAVVQAGVKATHLELDEELTFGLPHFLMMGLNEEYNGVINIVDQDFSMSFKTAGERNQANLEVAWERICEQGPMGLLELAKKKILTNFADGTFAWWEEGNFFWEERYEGNYSLRSLLTSFFYKDRENFELFKSLMQALWLGCLAGALLGVRMIGDEKVVGSLRLSIIGIILFELIFEARARYLFIYAPILILVAVIGIYKRTGELWKR